MSTQKVKEADVVIIGAGITGTAIARELSRYNVEAALVEKGGEIAYGASKATLGQIYTGLNMVGSMVLKSVVLPPGTPLTASALHDPTKMMTKWCDEGFKDWDQGGFDELDVRHRYNPVLVLAKDKDQIKDIETYVRLGESVGGIYADFKRLDRQAILALEPNVNPDVIMGLYAEDHLIDIFPQELVIALSENAVQNGVKLCLNTEVTGVFKKSESQVVQTKSGPIETKFIINAAGGWADLIADMAGGRDWELQYNRTPIVILDRRLKGLINGTVRWPNKPGEIQLVQAREDNIVIDCGYYETTHGGPGDTGSIAKIVRQSIAMAKTLVPAISEDDIISSFSGVRVFNTKDPGDHIVQFSPVNPKFLNVVIRLPGIIGALPMARYVVGMLADAGLQLTTKTDFNPCRKAIPKFRSLNNEARNQLIAKDSRYGRVICRCETVTEGEIVEAIRRGASTLDGVKFRTRASMGRCQGNFCGPKIADILARELGHPFQTITKKGEDSNYSYAIGTA